MSIRTKLQNKEHVIEALRRAKLKFSGCQKIHVSKKWGFTKFNTDEFENMVAEKRLIPDGFFELSSFLLKQKQQPDSYTTPDVGTRHVSLGN
eukprot:bmy_08631T0